MNDSSETSEATGLGGSATTFYGALRTSWMVWTWPLARLAVTPDRLELGLSFLPAGQRHVLTKEDVRALLAHRTWGYGVGLQVRTAQPGRGDGWTFYPLSGGPLFHCLAETGWAVVPESAN